MLDYCGLVEITILSKVCSSPYLSNKSGEATRSHRSGEDLTVNIGLDGFTGRPRQMDFLAFFFVIVERSCLFVFFDGAANVFTSEMSDVVFRLPKRMSGTGIGSSYICLGIRRERMINIKSRLYLGKL